jgi:hypothetical protein
MRGLSSLRKKPNRLQPVVALNRKAILKGPSARRAFDWLVTHGVDQEFLTTRLIGYPLSNQDRRKSEIVQGMDPRAIGRLPSDLDAMARRIALVNASPFMGPKAVLFAFSKGSSHQIEPIAKWVKEGSILPKIVNFECLPSILRELAEYVRAWFLIHAEAKGLGLWLTGRQVDQLRLLVHVAHRTGSPHFGRVATLLVAALAAAGDTRMGYRAVQSLSRRLKTLWKQKWFARLILAAEPPKPVPTTQAVVNVEAVPAPTPSSLSPAEQ